MRKNKLKLLKADLDVGSRLDKSFWQVYRALPTAYQELKKYREDFSQQKTNDFKYKIGVLGHEYIIYDPHISMNLITKLKNMAVDVVTAEMLDEKDLSKIISHLSKDMFWFLSKKMLGAAYHFF